MTLETSTLIACDRHKVFAAIADPDEIVRHFPLEAASVEPRVGGAVTLSGRVGDLPFEDKGTVLAYEPGAAFAYRYTSTNDFGQGPLRIAYTLAAEAGETRLSVVQSDITSEAYFDIMSGVWDALLAGLKADLERGD